MTTEAAHPVEPIDYRGMGAAASAAAVVHPPGILRVLAATSILMVVATIALSAFAATRAYYTAPPRRSPVVASWSAGDRLPPPRVTLAEGEAVVEGVSVVMGLTPKQREHLKEVLLKAEGQIKVEVGPDPTAAKVAAEVGDSGKLFGEKGTYAVIGQVRVEASEDRVKVMGVPNQFPMIEHSASSTSYRATSYSTASTWWFVPPPPDPATQRSAAAAVQRGPLELEIRRLAPQVLAAVDAAISALLALLLLAAAAGLWTYSRHGRWLHLLWAWLTLPLGLAAAVAYFWITLGGSVQVPSGVTPVVTFIIHHIQVLASLLLALYALAALVILNLPNVRRYFRLSPAA